MKKKILHLVISMFISQLNVYCQSDSLKGGEFYSSNFLVDDIQRDFIYYMPAHYGDSDSYPLLIFLHTEGESAQSSIKNYGTKIQQIADTSDCIVIYPDAIRHHWNVQRENDSINDVGFISILIDYFIQVYHANSKQIYLLGFSTGGELAWKISCRVPLKITALAAFNAQQKISKCSMNNFSAMNTDQFIDFTVKKNYLDAISMAWKFFMAHQKK
jgi:polyhydroxybutyrate depolymerase